MSPNALDTEPATATHAQAHWDAAVLLHRQRETLLAAADLDAQVLARNEYLSRMHLHVLARCDWGEPQAHKPPQVFVMLARRLSSPVAEVRRAGYAKAYALLVAGGDEARGAFAALALLPDGDEAALLELYRNHPQARPRLFDLWREQGRLLPQALLNHAELQGQDELLQEAALAYAASRPEIGVALFRPYYAPLQKNAAPGCSGRLTALALWGALARGEQGIAAALRRAVEREADPRIRDELLRLAALSADAEMLPVLRRLLEERPRQGARLLALHGGAAAIEVLIEALSRAATMEAAAGAWPWISGQALPRKTRLQLVGEESGEGSMPDAEAARAWWRDRRAALPPSGRMLQGAPLSLPRLHALAQNRAGEAGRDLLDLLALELRRPLGVSPHAEQARRRALLQGLHAPKVHQG